MIRDILTTQLLSVMLDGPFALLYLAVLLAIARQAEIPITIERIQAIGERVPLIGNLQPHGPYAMASLHAIGGVPVVMTSPGSNVMKWLT